MASIPKVKVTFDADLDGLKRGTASAENEVSGFSKSVEKFGGMATAAFAAAAAAAAAYAVKLGVDGVKAAIEDEQAQSRLAQTLKAAAGATDETVAATEKFISSMQMATGVSDTTLRSAMGRLTLSTNDVTKSQELLQLALDISAGTGKSVESVANALGKAYDGQTTALGKLGVGLSSAELKGQSFTDVQQKLSDLFGGAASENAKTFQGQIDIMKQRFGEFQEAVGQQVIPILLKLFNFVNENIGPAFEWFKKNAIEPVSEAIARNKDTFMAYYNFIKDNIIPIIGGGLMLAIKGLGTAASVIVNAVGAAIRFLEPIINAAVDGINLIIRGINFIKSGPDIPYLKHMNTSPVYSGNPNLQTNTSSTNLTIPSTSTSITPSTTTKAEDSLIAKIAEETAKTTFASVGAKPFTTPMSISGQVYNPTFASVGAKPFTTPMSISSQTPIIVNVNAPSVIDEQGFTNAVVSALNNSTYRGTSGAGMLAGLAI